MKKKKYSTSTIYNIENPKHKYSLVISWIEGKQKKYKTYTLYSRELDIQQKARQLFYRIVKEKTGILLHNLQKPFEQERHAYTSKTSINEYGHKEKELVRKQIQRSEINAPKYFDYTFCIV